MREAALWIVGIIAIQAEEMGNAKALKRDVYVQRTVKRRLVRTRKNGVVGDEVLDFRSSRVL